MQLHDLLYSNEFGEFDLGIPYMPHMTVGKLKTVDDLNSAYDSVMGNKTLFKSIITIYIQTFICYNTKQLRGIYND